MHIVIIEERNMKHCLNFRTLFFVEVSYFILCHKGQVSPFTNMQHAQCSGILLLFNILQQNFGSFFSFFEANFFFPKSSTYIISLLSSHSSLFIFLHLTFIAKDSYYFFIAKKLVLEPFIALQDPLLQVLKLHLVSTDCRPWSIAWFISSLTEVVISTRFSIWASSRTSKM